MTVSEAIMEPLLIQKIYAKKDKEGPIQKAGQRKYDSGRTSEVS